MNNDKFKEFCRTMDARVVLLLMLVCPFIALYILPHRTDLSDKSKIGMSYFCIIWTVIAFVCISVGIFTSNSPNTTTVGNSGIYTTTEAPATTRRRAETTHIYTTSTERTTTSTASPETSASETSDTTIPPDTAAETPTETTAQTTTETTTTTKATTTTEPPLFIYTDPPAVQTQTQVVYRDYLYNSNSGIFHSTGCRTIPDNMGDHWITYYSTTSDYMRSLGYKPCGTCKP